MTSAPACPRCLGQLAPPDLWSDQFRCASHGDVAPFHQSGSSPADALRQLGRTSSVPVWVPTPMPVHWYVGAVGWAGDERTGARAAALATAGPCPVGGPAEMVLVAESPGIGLAARLAGIDGTDPRELATRPETKVEANGHPTALWPVASPPDRTGYVGEAGGVWLWVLLWPADAALLLLENLVLADLRDRPALVDTLFFGAHTDRLLTPLPDGPAPPG
ncbi:MAG: phosphotransacetylase [Frankia sp.]|nr:phosphotransacetylase [Frankia sp.]